MADTTVTELPTTAAVAATRSTLYPKISGDIRDTIHHLEKHHRINGTTPTGSLPLTGTVKLHGTHADIRVYPDGRIIAQSRNNNALSAEKDNFDFAKFCLKQAPHILHLAERIRARWTELNPTAPSLDTNNTPANATIILAGEWVGQKIQSRPRTAIRDLSRRFVLYGIRSFFPSSSSTTAWEPIEQYADIADEAAHLYNIGRGGFFHLSLDLADRGAAFLAEARRLAEEVHARCPFGAALGVEGPGEGIVWMPAASGTSSSFSSAAGVEPVPNVPGFWLKTKGEGFEGRPRRDPNAPSPPPKDTSKQEAAAAFVRGACNERRLEQGWDYLREMHLPRAMTSLPRFMAWVTGDIEVEERNDIEELSIGSVWKKEAFRIGKDWYVRRLAEGGGGGGEDGGG